MNEESRRVSDLEREQAVVALRDDLVAGRLTLDEFGERVDRAYRSRTGGELARLREDLPSPVRAATTPGRRRTRFTAALFAHVIRRGRLRLRRRTVVLGSFADVDFDLREAELGAPRLTVTILVFFANVDVYVPEGIDVDVGGTIVFGHRRDWGRDAAYVDAPAIRVRARGLFGTVDVWRVPHGMRGTYREILRQLQEQQRRLPA